MTLPDLCFIDVETTGLDPATDEILEVAAVRVHPVTLHIVATFFRQVLPSAAALERMSAEARVVNRFDPKQWAEALPFAAAVDELVPVMEGSMFAGQNPRFDEGFLKAAFARAGRPWPKFESYHLLDVGSLVWPLVLRGDIPGVSLRHTVKYFGLGEQKHRALADVMHAIQVYEHVCFPETPAKFVPRVEKDGMS